jgi:hypothetical protein
MRVYTIREALDHVRELQQAVLERQRFKGYSGRARMTSGAIALVAAAVMASPLVPDRDLTHIVGWGLVFCMAFLLNGVAMIWWFLHDPVPHRDIRVLKPVIDVAAPIVVGGLLTATMILHGQYQYLFGIWMCLFGLTNVASRMVLPRMIWVVGCFYILAGAVCLLMPGLDFKNPWPMGVIFFAGEWVGGLILHYDGTRNVHATAKDEGANRDDGFIA